MKADHPGRGGPGYGTDEAGQSDQAEPARGAVDPARQLRDAADAMVRGWSAAAGAAALPKPPELPAALSARRLQAMLDDVAAQRARLRALRDQLDTFDVPLGQLHDSLHPLLEWARGWADLERAVTELCRPGKPAGG